MAVPPRTRRRSLVGRSPVITPIAYRTIAEQIAGSIREAIAQGTIPPAARLLEVHLARDMGTSRAPVREALSHLEREGWVVKEPNRGARVLELTEETIREVASLRGVLEGFAASLAVARLIPKDIETLEGMLADMERAARGGAYPRLIDLDFQFHAFVCKASGHRMLYETWSGMAGKIRLYQSATNLMYRDLKSVVRGHRVLLDALKSRDQAKACRAMGDHLGEMLNPFIARLVSSRAQAYGKGGRGRRLAAGRSKGDSTMAKSRRGMREARRTSE